MKTHVKGLYDYNLEDWREAFHREQAKYQATKNRLRFWTDQANAHERVLLQLLFDVAKALASPDVTDDYLWKQAHFRFNELVDAELEEIWADREDSE